MSQPELAVSTGAYAGAGTFENDLDWVSDVLWGCSDGVEATARGVAAGELLDVFGVFPRAGRPRLLVPLCSRRAAAESFRRYPSSRRTVRTATRLASVLSSAGLSRMLLPSRVYVVATSTGSEETISDHLRTLLDVRDLEVAVVFSSGRPQKKPVLQLMDPEGRTFAYAKVGWNTLTRTLVEREAEILTRLGTRRLDAVTVPRLLAADSWRGRELTVVESPPPRPWYRRRRMVTALPIAATRELMRVEPAAVRGLTASDYWTDCINRLQQLVASGQPRPATAQVMFDVAGWIEANYGALDLPFGFAHGDWVPWNMTSIEERLYAWDWERSEQAAPLGLDLVHFLFQVELNLRKRTPAVAVDRTIELGAALLEQVDLDPALVVPLLGLHLLQMLLRLEEGRTGGIDGVIPNERYRRAFVTLLPHGRSKTKSMASLPVTG